MVSWDLNKGPFPGSAGGLQWCLQGDPSAGLSFQLTHVGILVWFLAWPRMVAIQTVSPSEGRACDCLLTLGTTVEAQPHH